MTEEFNVTDASDIDLVNIVNQTEGLAWRMNHDAAHDRIPSEGVDDSISELRKVRDEAVAEITKRTGISEVASMREYIQVKLKEQDEMWDKQWAELYTEGAVFKYKDELNVKNPFIFETVRTYLPTGGTFGPNAYIFARVKGTLEFKLFDDREIVNLVKAEESAIYKGLVPEDKGLIKADEALEKRIRRIGNYDVWRSIDAWDHTVFYHKGFDEVFEATAKYNFPDKERCAENELILARSHSRPVFVEFNQKDIGLITLRYEKPKYKFSKFEMDLNS